MKYYIYQKYLDLLGFFTISAFAICFAVSPAISKDKSTLAWGVHGISDWSTAMAFIDIMKTSRPLEMHGAGQPAVKYNDLKKRGFLDRNGWPTKLDPKYERFATLWAWDNDSPARGDRKGRYVLTYEGDGSFEFKNVGVVSQRKGEIILDNPRGGAMLMYITATDPRGVGNHIRNISIVKEEHLTLHKRGQHFNPKWLKLVQDAQLLRFLNWMHGNNATIENWKDRVRLENPTWFTDNGVPIEVIITLANQIKIDPWFTLPHTANDRYIKRFAQLVEKTLDPSLVAHVEYSNEHWNFGFKQFHYFAKASRDAWRKDAPPQFYSKRATETALIWREVFEGQENRIKTVLGVHTANSGNVKELLNPRVWKRRGRASYVDPKTAFDAVGVTTYFGVATVSKRDLRDDLLAQIKKSENHAANWLKEKLLDPNYQHSIPQVVSQWKAIKDQTEPLGLELLAYEGGQHVHHLAFLDGITEEEIEILTKFLSSFTRSKHMADLYDVLWTEWKKYGDGPFMQFGDVGAASKWGSYSAYSHLDDRNPRADFLRQKASTEEPWW